MVPWDTVSVYFPSCNQTEYRRRTESVNYRRSVCLSTAAKEKGYSRASSMEGWRRGVDQPQRRADITSRHVREMGLGTDCAEVKQKPAGYCLWCAAVAVVGGPVYATWGGAVAPRVDASTLPSQPFQSPVVTLYTTMFNHLTPNGHYMGRTAQLTSRCCILYIYSTNIRTEYFKHAA